MLVLYGRLTPSHHHTASAPRPNSSSLFRCRQLSTSARRHWASARSAGGTRLSRCLASGLAITEVAVSAAHKMSACDLPQNSASASAAIASAKKATSKKNSTLKSMRGRR
jgi:hypothetical protein